MTQITARYWTLNPEGYHTEHTVSGDIETVLGDLLIQRMSGTINGWETYACDLDTYQSIDNTDWQTRDSLRTGSWYDRLAMAGRMTQRDKYERD